jgi:3-dehydro-4-phosphotetronate decarboxylase
MNEAARPTDHEIEAAARVLYEEGRFHHWWPTITKSYDEFAGTDPIGISEFGGIVERILMAASKARLNTEMPPPS